MDPGMGWFLFFLSFLIVPYRSDPWARRLAPACKHSAEAGFGHRNVIGN
jgi:hypothetical protein